MGEVSCRSRAIAPVSVRFASKAKSYPYGESETSRDASDSDFRIVLKKKKCFFCQSTGRYLHFLFLIVLFSSFTYREIEFVSDWDKQTQLPDRQAKKTKTNQHRKFRYLPGFCKKKQMIKVAKLVISRSEGTIWILAFSAKFMYFFCF